MTASDASEPDAKSSGSTLKYVLYAFVVIFLGCGFLTCAGTFLVAIADPADFDEASGETVEPIDEEFDEEVGEAPKEETKKPSKARKSEKASRGSSRKKSKGKRKRR